MYVVSSLIVTVSRLVYDIVLPLSVLVDTVRRGYGSSMGIIVNRSIGYHFQNVYVVMIMWLLFSSGMSKPVLSIVGF